MSNASIPIPFNLTPHSKIANLYIIYTLSHGNCYYSSIYRMIKLYKLDNELIQKVPSLEEFLKKSDELGFIIKFKEEMCNYLDKPENDSYIRNLISNFKGYIIK